MLLSCPAFSFDYTIIIKARIFVNCTLYVHIIKHFAQEINNAFKMIIQRTLLKTLQEELKNKKITAVTGSRQVEPIGKSLYQ